MTQRRTKPGDAPTGRQAEALRLIWAHLLRTGMPPTVRHLMRLMGVTSPNGMMCHLKALEARGYLVARDRLRGVGTGGNNSSAAHTIRLAGVRMVPALEGEAGERLRAALGGATAGGAGEGEGGGG